MINFFTTPTKTHATPFVPNGVYYGIVKRVDATINRVWVEIPRLTPDFDFGPVSVVGQQLPPVGKTVACMFVENSTENLVVLGPFLSIGDVTETTVSITLTTTTPSPIHSISGTMYRSAKFTVQVTRGTNFLFTEILATHDGTTGSFAEYGRVIVGSSPASFDVDFVSGNLVLKATSTSASATTYKIKTSAFAL